MEHIISFEHSSKGVFVELISNPAKYYHNRLCKRKTYFVRWKASINNPWADCFTTTVFRDAMRHFHKCCSTTEKIEFINKNNV